MRWQWQCQCQWQCSSLIGQGRRVLPAVPAGATRWSRQPGERSLQPVAHHRQQDQEDQPESQADHKGEGRHGFPEQLQFYLSILQQCLISFISFPCCQMLLVIILVFTLCWFPRFLLNIIKYIRFYPSDLSFLQAWTIWGTLDRWVALTYDNTEFFMDTPFLYFSQVLLTWIYHLSLLIELDPYLQIAKLLPFIHAMMNPIIYRCETIFFIGSEVVSDLGSSHFFYLSWGLRANWLPQINSHYGTNLKVRSNPKPVVFHDIWIAKIKNPLMQSDVRFCASFCSGMLCKDSEANFSTPGEVQVSVEGCQVPGARCQVTCSVMGDWCQPGS